MQHVKDKENRVADALSRNLHGVYELYYNQIECKFLEQIKIEAEKDPEYQFIWQQAEEAKRKEKPFDYGISKDQLLTFKENIYVPNRTNLKELILNEYHWSNYSRHPRYTNLCGSKQRRPKNKKNMLIMELVRINC